MKENKKICRLGLEEKTQKFKIIQQLQRITRTEIDIEEDESILNALYSRDQVLKQYKSLKKYDAILKIINIPGVYYFPTPCSFCK